jgi:outer membrane protein assembly factor BamB
LQPLAWNWYTPPEVSILLQPASFLLVLVACVAQADDNWPQWRGPLLNGSTTTAKNLPVHWTETENVVWRTKLPSWSAATPIIWGDTIFVTSAEAGFQSTETVKGVLDDPVRGGPPSPLEKILLFAINRQDGSVRWQQVVGMGNKVVRKQNMASPSPVTDGRHVWVLTGSGWLTCLDFDGKQIWQREIEKEYGELPAMWGYASSPLLYQGRLFVQVLHQEKKEKPPYLLALNAETGKTLWKMQGGTDAVWGSPDSYSTPTLAEANGKKELVVSGGGYVTGHDPETGKELWHAGGLNPGGERRYRTVPSLVPAGDVVFASTRRRLPFIAFRAGGSGDVSKSGRLWSSEYGPEVPTPTTDGQRLYIIDDKGVALCLRVDNGTTIWGRERLVPGLYNSSPLLADGKLYAMDEDGSTTVIEAGDKFKILGVNKLNDFTLASPAASGDRIFIRTGQYLYCIGAK